MPTFRYQALSRGGQTIRGELDAANKAAAISRLQSQGLVPLVADQAQEGSLRALLERDILTGAGLSGKEVAAFVQQLATFIVSGVTVEQALAMLIRMAGSARTRRVVEGLLRRIRSGSSLAEAMQSERNVFPAIAIGMVRAGEASGSLATTLASLGDYLRRTEEMRSRIRSALVYPTILVLTAIVSVSIILTVVVPQLEPMFQNSETTLPLATRIVVAASEALRGWWWAIIPAVGGAVIGAQRWLANPAARSARDRGLLKMPLLGATIRKAETARFARTLGTLVKGSVPMSSALAIAQSVISNAVLGTAIQEIAVRVKEGGGLADLIERSRVFPDITVQFTRLGEATGRLGEMLVSQADIFDTDVQRMIERALAVFVPALTIVLGIVVGGIVTSVLVAMLSINDLAQ